MDPDPTCSFVSPVFERKTKCNSLCLLAISAASTQIGDIVLGDKVYKLLSCSHRRSWIASKLDCTRNPLYRMSLMIYKGYLNIKIEFSVNNVPGIASVSKASYEMAPANVKELKEP